MPHRSLRVSNCILVLVMAAPVIGASQAEARPHRAHRHHVRAQKPAAASDNCDDGTFGEIFRCQLRVALQPENFKQTWQAAAERAAANARAKDTWSRHGGCPDYSCD